MVIVGAEQTVIAFHFVGDWNWFAGLRVVLKPERVDVLLLADRLLLSPQLTAGRVAGFGVERLVEQFCFRSDRALLEVVHVFHRTSGDADSDEALQTRQHRLTGHLAFLGSVVPETDTLRLARQIGFVGWRMEVGVG